MVLSIISVITFMILIMTVFEPTYKKPNNEELPKIVLELEELPLEQPFLIKSKDN